MFFVIYCVVYVTGGKKTHHRGKRGRHEGKTGDGPPVKQAKTES